MTSAIAEVIFLEVFMEKEKILEIVNEINKIARLNCMYNKIEETGEEYDSLIEDFYFIEWLRMASIFKKDTCFFMRKKADLL